MEYIVPVICAVAITSAIYALYWYYKFQKQQSNNIPKRILKEITKLNKRDKHFIQNYLCQGIIVLHDLLLKRDMNGEFDKAVIPTPNEMVVSIKRTTTDESYPSIEILDTYVRTTAKRIKYEVTIEGRSAITIEWRRASLLGGNYITTSIARVADLKVLEWLCYEYLIKPFKEDE